MRFIQSQYHANLFIERSELITMTAPQKSVALTKNIPSLVFIWFQFPFRSKTSNCLPSLVATRIRSN